MTAILKFVRHHWLTLALLVGSLVLVGWIVQTKRAPGSMTIVEAQGMDMATMKPPPGTFPVAVEEAASGQVGSESSYPAELSAYSDEEVVARVPGLVMKVLVYPGDKVRAGQLLATLQADEIAAQALEARLRAAAKADDGRAAWQELEGAKASLRRAKAGFTTAEANHVKTMFEHESMEAHADAARQSQAAAQAQLFSARSDLKYAEQQLAREEKLYKSGAISLDEYQLAQRERETKRAAVDASEANARAATSLAIEAGKHLQVAGQVTVAAKSAIEEAKASVGEAQSNLWRLTAKAGAATKDTGAAHASARALAALADYRNLRALSNGEVAERVVSPGTSVMAGQTVLRLKVVNRIRVQVDLPQALSGVVQVGTPVVVRGEGIDRFARITSVFPTVSTDTRTFRVEALVDNADKALKPGMFARLSLTSGPSNRSLTLRSSAIRTDAEGGSYVWVLGEHKGGGKATDWTCTMHPEVSEKGPGYCPKCPMRLVPREGTGRFLAEKRVVVAGPSNAERTAILSGLKPGDKVIWAGHEDLYPGAPVEPTEWSESGPKEAPKSMTREAPSAEPMGHQHG